MSLIAVKSNAKALRVVSESFIHSKEFVLKAVSVNGIALRFAIPSLKLDKDVIFNAVR
jgi:hypothetical protein